ncbi:DEAD/DEAH box helicase [Fulvivirga ligni]|uniref:DEAD/DEAH box helicase n=1 Tax=Fulvivirga ligni TaxID=2904246 RepID=UPI001F1E1A9A|nr:DEAD/DEAH box helicase [Fulvivirga ligni]UII19484.1 DEAD/DEAH box helicase [Fulvivirga ligni]
MTNFSNLGLSDPLLKVLNELNFESPTKIQQQAIPVLINEGDSDFIGLAQTGTGKTAAFGLPLLESIDPARKETQAVVLAPTRELGQQIGQQLESFSKYMDGVNIVTVYGGASIQVQIKALKKKPQIVIATPGRLLDLLNRKAVDLASVRFVVLDEADEMLNMGFREDLDHILSYTEGEKATWLFSATMAKEIKNIVKKYMNNPNEVKIDSGNVVNTNIDHQYFAVKAKDKPNLLQYIIQLEPDMRGIIFCRTKRDTQSLTEQLQKRGLPVDALHGDLSQAQRDQVMKRFKNHTLEFLLCTDVAARGIDVNDITHVIHYALPDDTEYYTHRSGRTGRAGKTGISLALVSSSDQRKLNFMQKKLNLKFSEYTLPSPVAVENQKLITWAKRVMDVKTDVQAIKDHQSDIYELFNELSKEELIDKLLTIELDKFGIRDQGFDVADLDNVSLDSRSSRESEKSPYKKFFINIGKMDGFNKSDLIEFVMTYSEIKKKSIGEITIEERRSYFEVLKEDLSQMDGAFTDLMLDGREIRVNAANRGGGGGGNGGGKRSDRNDGRSFKRNDRKRSSGRGGGGGGGKGRRSGGGRRR